MLWQCLTAASRLTSAILIVVVYRGHWTQVAMGDIVRPALFYSAFYFVLAIVANVGLHWACLGQVNIRTHLQMIKPFSKSNMDILIKIVISKLANESYKRIIRSHIT